MITEDELHRMSNRELAEVLRKGHAIDTAWLDDTAWRGTALGLPVWVEKLTWKKFQKVFHRDPARGVLRGWNVRLAQNALEEPCVPLIKRGEPFTFGHYHVVPLVGRSTPRPCGPGLLIDYGPGGNGAGDPMSLMRDPLVAVNDGDRRLLLGWSYAEMGAVRVGTPSYFSLVPVGKLERFVEPPRG